MSNTISKEDMLTKGLSSDAMKNLFGTSELHELWICKADPRFSYWLYLPDCYLKESDREWPLVAIVHGTSRNGEKYMEVAKKYADQYKFAVICPMFPCGILDDHDINGYKLLSAGGLRFDNIFLKMLDEAKSRYPQINIQKFCMFGHSGGGQFINRFLFVHPERLAAAGIGAPGRPTFIDFTQDYFWGIKNFKEIFNSDFKLDAVQKVPVRLIVGENDTKFIGESQYGTTRVARMESLLKNFQDNGIKSDLVILPNLEHKGGEDERLKAALDLFLKVLH